MPEDQTTEIARDTVVAASVGEQPAALPAVVPELDLRQIKEYARVKRWCHLSGIALSLAYWIAWVSLAAGFVTWLDNGIDNRWIGLFVAALVMVGGHIVVGLPLDYYSGFVVERRFDLSNQTPWSWLVFQVKTWLVGGILAVILLGGLYGALWYGGAAWGVYVWIGMMVLSIVLAKLFPLVILPLFYPAKPLDSPTLVERLTAMARGVGMTVTGVYNLALSKDTKKANAMLAGLGSTRRVYLSDTLVGAFGEDQIAVVFAHELGHHIRRHILKMIALSAVVSSILVALIWWRLNPFTGSGVAWVGAVAAFAQVMLIATLYPLVIGPATNAVSRRFERQADRLALDLTNDPPAYRSAFDLLTRMNLADPDPPRWEEILFDDHPAMNKRIALADEWEQSRSLRGPVGTCEHTSIPQ
ncbi:MAG: M48 family metallopeptidase [Planctomycetes bacterium]|nr:M48 family metallopeptidase [Planctomycetota bacterium]